MNRPPVEHPFIAQRIQGFDDFAPELDVPSAGRAASDALAADIAAVRARPDPDATRKIHLFRGAAGYGKSHLFGRVSHSQPGGVQFVLIDSPPDTGRAVENTRWRLVDTLFHSGSGIAPIRTQLARLLAPSFAAYFDQLSPALRTATGITGQDILDDPLRALQVLGGVADLAPYHTLADSFLKQLPRVPGGVVRALVLGLSPAAEDVRTWLRGEANNVSPDRLDALRLDAESPCPTDVILGIASLLRLANVPLVVFFDQLDVLYTLSPTGFINLAAQAMGWLQTVPNLVVGLGSLDTGWAKIEALPELGAFIDRVQVHKLDLLTADEAAEVVTRRMKTWAELPTGRPDGWPFDLDSVRHWATAPPTAPRALVAECDRAFGEWRLGDRKSLIRLGGYAPKLTEPELFVQAWTAELEATRASLKAATEYQDAELWAGVAAAVEVARLGKHLPAGVTLDKITPKALAATPADSRPSAELHLIAGPKRASVVVAVSKKDSGAAFANWVGALESAIGGHVAGAVVVWPKSQLAVGKTAAAYKRYASRVSAGTVRPFPLDDNADAFAQFECLRQLIAKAQAGDLTLGDKPVSATRCRELAAETGVLAKLKLFEFLFENWAGFPAVAAAPSITPPSITAPARPAPNPSAATARQPAAVTPAGSSAEVAAQRVVTPPTPPAQSPSWAEQQLALVVQKLRDRGNTVKGAGVEVGPTFVRLKLELQGDADFGKLKRQVDNLKIQMGLTTRPIIASQAGHVSVDIQRPDRQTVPLAPHLTSRPAALAGRPAFVAGVDVAGKPHWLDLADPANCHLLVAGTTGSGKSEFLKAVLAGLAASLPPSELRFILIDPKQVTFRFDGASPYIPEPIVYDAAEAIPAIKACHAEMRRRYKLLQDRHLEHVGQLTGTDALPRWVVVIDEFADLMTEKATKKELEGFLRSLGGMARAAGIHLILGTQRPEATVVPPLLRANLPGRVALRVTSERESKLVIDGPDAAYLLDKGDLLTRAGGGLLRLQSPLVPKSELGEFLRVH